MSNIHGRRPIYRESTTPTPANLQATDSSNTGSEEQCGSNVEASFRSPSTPNCQRIKAVNRTPLRLNSVATTDESNNTVLYTLMGVIVACAVLMGYLSLYTSEMETVLKNCSYDELQRRYPLQYDSTWRILSVGIENILNKRAKMPSVYLFVHEGGNSVHDLVRAIAVKSSACFDQQMLPIEMRSDDFTSESAVNDYGYAIEKFKKKIKLGHVILIANLNEIPAEAARALHTICDTHSPLATDVVIFLTLVVQDMDKNPSQNAEDTLVELWGNKLGRNELDPLITRVTDQVIHLQS